MKTNVAPANPTLQNLITKLHPKRYSNMSAKMAWILSCILGTDWAKGPRGEAPTRHFSITSDGHVVSGDMYIGDKTDFISNITRLLEVADLDEDERAAFLELYSIRVTDWSKGFASRGEL